MTPSQIGLPGPDRRGPSPPTGYVSYLRVKWLTSPIKPSVRGSLVVVHLVILTCPWSVRAPTSRARPMWVALLVPAIIGAILILRVSAAKGANLNRTKAPSGAWGWCLQHSLPDRRPLPTLTKSSCLIRRLRTYKEWNSKVMMLITWRKESLYSDKCQVLCMIMQTLMSREGSKSASYGVGTSVMNFSLIILLSWSIANWPKRQQSFS